MDFLRILFTTILPIIVIAVIIYRVDRFDREPIKLLAKIMFFGAAAPTMYIRMISTVIIKSILCLA